MKCEKKKSQHGSSKACGTKQHSAQERKSARQGKRPSMGGKGDVHACLRASVKPRGRASDREETHEGEQGIREGSRQGPCGKNAPHARGEVVLEWESARGENWILREQQA